MVSSLDEFQEYLRGIMIRADHHAGNVNVAVLTLTGAILWMKDSGPMEVFEREGKMTNVGWVKINGKRYAFSYNHNTAKVEMRRGSTQGDVLLTVSNDTEPAEMLATLRNITK